MTTDGWILLGGGLLVGWTWAGTLTLAYLDTRDQQVYDWAKTNPSNGQILRRSAVRFATWPVVAWQWWRARHDKQD